jgi:iron complex transport system permease protein
MLFHTKQLCILIILCFLLMMAIFWGPVSLQIDDWKFWEEGFLEPGRLTQHILWHLRIPRALFAVLAGMILGYCGALTQGVFRNPLADPGLIGISAGAAASTALAIVFIQPLLESDYFLNEGLSISPILPILPILPLSSFIGALMTCYFLVRLSSWLMSGSVSGLLLIGIALNAILASWIGLCTYLANDDQLRSLTFWTLGSVASGNWNLILVAIVLLSIAITRLRSIAKYLNAISLGEEVAQHLGVDIFRVRREAIIWIALLNGLVVSWCGVISFIGLLAPNMARLFVGADQKKNIPISMFFGGCLLSFADSLAKNLASPAEIPVGIFTALLGGPIFLIILIRHRS